MLPIRMKFVVDNDFANYKRNSMFIGLGVSCNWKCGEGLCQNHSLAGEPEICCMPKALVERYLNNPLSHALVIGGLEPFDNEKELLILTQAFREKTEDEIIIYTGYNKNEDERISSILDNLSKYKNIIVKFGRYVPNQEPHFDELLGVELSSFNQYAERIS